MTMKAKHIILLVLTAMLLISGTLAVARHAFALECLYGSCASGAKERLFGPGIGGPDVTKRGYGSWNDLYNQRHQERYRSGTRAEPFDLGSSADRSARQPHVSEGRPEARNEHVRWCLKRYRSYAVETNTYVTYGGRTRYCDSPFN